MRYGTWSLAMLASVVLGFDAKDAERLEAVWRQIGELVASFFGPRGLAGRGVGV